MDGWQLMGVHSAFCKERFSLQLGVRWWPGGGECAGVGGVLLAHFARAVVYRAGVASQEETWGAADAIPGWIQKKSLRDSRTEHFARLESLPFALESLPQCSRVPPLCSRGPGAGRMVDAATKDTVQKLPLLTVKAGPRDGDEWVKRMKEELLALIAYQKVNKENGNEWFTIER